MTQTTSSHPERHKPLHRLAALALCVTAIAPAAFAQTKFADATPDELAMTSLPGYPGVAAVVLNREQITKDDMHSVSHYERIKILTEDGKKYANVELAFVSTNADFSPDNNGDDKTLEDIQGRTIHPDGTVIPFTGKPYVKVMEKGKGIKVQEKVFTLPDVTVGSIIEYRYSTRINDNVYESPTWLIQGDLYLKNAHYMWYPTSETLHNSHGELHFISWFPILPKGAEIVHHEIPGAGARGLPQYTYEVTVKDVPPIIDEEYMPPLANYSYRVYWNMISERDGDDYWKSEGRDWSKNINSFTNPNGDLKSATQQIIAGATTQDQKLRAIYAAVQKMENTHFTRQHDNREDKAAGLSKLNSVADVFKRERGSPMQLTELFIGMARAAGLQADAMLIPDRSKEMFLPQWLSFRQFDDLIAVVNVDGKDQFFDPGERCTPYGHLTWQHTFVKGLRQKGSETAFDNTPGDGYKDNTIARVANLTMDATGNLTGKIDMTYSGASAIRWRQASLRGDDESLKHQLRTSLEGAIPHSLEVKDVTIANIADYEKPLNVTYHVEGTLGSWTGKRLVLPIDLFLVNHKATFPHEKREIAVAFSYPSWTRDALRINFPSTFSIEAAPAAVKYNLEKAGAYGMGIESAATSFTTRREFLFADIYVLPDAYPKLRSFYSQFETNDQQSIILKTSAAPTTTASATPAANE